MDAALEALLRQAGDYEVIIVDGGSTDQTCALAMQFPVRVVCVERGQPPGIGHQINLGAQAAQGNILLFLHADVQLPTNGVALIEAALANPDITGGGFVPAFRNIEPPSEHRLLKWVERMWQFRTRRFCWFAGDTAPFIRADVFRQCGGYSTASFASDWDFAGQLRRLRRLVVIDQAVGVDCRRHIYNGVLKTLLVTGSVEFMYRIGVSRVFLRAWYRSWLPHERDLRKDNPRNPIYE